MTDPRQDPPPGYAPAPAPGPSGADASRTGEQYAIRLRRHTGMVLVAQTRTTVVRGSLEQCRAAYRSAQTHDFTLGWWGIFSLLLYNWIAIVGNVRARQHLDALAAPPA